MTAEKTSFEPSRRGTPGEALPPAHDSLQGLLWLGLFVIALALLGGSSRHDPIQNAALRPIAALLLMPALYRLRATDLAGVRTILVLGGLMLGWMILQLIPLPPVIWQALPGRAEIAGLDKLAGLDGTWRPISLAPFRGLNAVFGMVIPMIAFVLAVSARITAQKLLMGITLLGSANAGLGILQAIGGPMSPFYLFAITNRGAPVGFFANENHAAVFAAIVLLVIARLAVEVRAKGLPAWFKLSLVPAYLVILIAVLLSGSRAGLSAALLAIGAGGLMVAMDWWSGNSGRVARRGQRMGLALIAAGGAGAMLLIAAFLLLGRTPAVHDLVASNSLEDLRWSLWPVLAGMMKEHLLLGTGLGSFDAVYRLYEPTALLLPLYINQAHNDWAQLVIEGGLPALALLLGLIGWFAAAMTRLSRRTNRRAALLIFWIAWLAIMAAASAVDYPLRTPIFQAVSVWLMLCLARDGTTPVGATSEPQ